MCNLYLVFKKGMCWVFSSKLASLTCMPQYKVEADNEADALFAVSLIKKRVTRKKAHAKQLSNNRKNYRLRKEMGNTRYPTI